MASVIGVLARAHALLPAGLAQQVRVLSPPSLPRWASSGRSGRVEVGFALAERARAALAAHGVAYLRLLPWPASHGWGRPLRWRQIALEAGRTVYVGRNAQRAVWICLASGHVTVRVRGATVQRRRRCNR